MSKFNLAPHLHTYQRNTLSKQILDGFFIFHIEADQYEQWNAEDHTWRPMLDSNNNPSGAGSTNEVVSGTMVAGNLLLTKSDNTTVTVVDVDTTDDFDHFIFNSISQTVTLQDALDDWANI